MKNNKDIELRSEEVQVDNGRYPTPKTVLLGLSVTF